MSHNKSLQLKTILTLGVAALALCVSNGPVTAAGAPRAERAGALAHMVRGGGGEMRSMGVNGKFNAIRVERISPAAFTAPGKSNAPERVNARRSPEPPVTPPLPPTNAQTPTASVQGPVQDPVQPRTNFQGPTTGMRGWVQDPVEPSTDVQAPGKSNAPERVDARRSPEPPVPPPLPPANAQTPTASVQGPVQDPVQPRTNFQGPTTGMRGWVQDPVEPSTNLRGPSTSVRGPVQDPTVRPSTTPTNTRRSPEPPVSPPQAW